MIVTASLSARASDSCNDELSGRSDLILTQTKTERESGEVEFAGITVNRKQQFDEIWQAGVYVYIITLDGTVSYAHRVGPGISDDEEIFVSHRSLLRKLEKRTGKTQQIVAAGEFRFEHGRVTSINNGAGSFRGSAQHLQLAVDELSERGLAIEPSTEREDYSDPSVNHERFHANAMKIGRAVHQVRRDPVLQKDFERLSEVYAQIAKDFPNSKRPGLADGYLSSQRLDYVRLMKSHMSELQLALQVFKMIDENGVEFALADFSRLNSNQFTKVSFDDLLNFIVTVVPEYRR